jgi:thiol-disulfide isomerase/thioredoxin
MTPTRTRRYVLGSALALAATAAGALAFFDRPALAQAKDTKSLKGKAAPDFSLKTADDKDVKLSEHKGKVVVLDFWATWCPPCVKGLPHINELGQDKARADKGLVVLAVNVQEKPEQVKKFMEAKKLALTVPMDAEGKASEAYMVQGIPTTVIVDRDGKISEVFVGLPNPITAIDTAVDRALGGGTTK